MDSTSRRSGEAILEAPYRGFMRRNSVYVTFVVVGAFLGERVVNYAVYELWVYNNRGLQRWYEDIPVLGKRVPQE